MPIQLQPEVEDLLQPLGAKAADKMLKQAYTGTTDECIKSNYVATRWYKMIVFS